MGVITEICIKNYNKEEELSGKHNLEGKELSKKSMKISDWLSSNPPSTTNF